MTKTRLEAFSEGVLAIIITIMVLELRAPHRDTPDALVSLYPIFLGYVLSFTNVGIYWSNHHHMLHAAEHIGGAVQRRRLTAGSRAWAGRQRQNLPRAVRSRHRAGFRRPADCARDLRIRGDHVVHPGPPLQRAR